MRHAYQILWVPKYVERTPEEMDALRALHGGKWPRRKNIPKENPDWLALINGSFLAPEGARLVSLQSLTSPPDGIASSVLVPLPTGGVSYVGDGFLITLEREHSLDTPYRDTAR